VEKDLFNGEHMSQHPKGLPYLFLTEMWERYGFYVVQGMLILYLTKAYGFPDDKSFTILGLFSALAYVSPLLGGIIADRVLGFKTSIIWGGVFLILGYALLAAPLQQGFYPALAIIIVGTGLFKPNISSLLGALYQPGDSARETGFTIFYIGINLGVLLAGLSSGYIKDHYGWNIGFALASLGLVIGLSIFCFGIHRISPQGSACTTHSKSKWLSKPWLLFYCLIVIVDMDLLLQSELLGKWFLPLIGVAIIFFIFTLALKQQPEARSNLLTLNILIISSVIFWAIFLQMFLATNLFIDRLIDRHIWGMEIPTTAFYALESAFVILLGPFFAIFWSRLNRSHKNVSPIFKFVIGIVFAGLGCLALSMSTHFADVNNLINPLWIVLAYLLITIGELLLSPIGLAAVTILSPAGLTGLMMGVWFAGMGFGGQLAGMLAKLASIPLTVGSTAEKILIYRTAFLEYACIAFFVAFILFIIYRKQNAHS
jgi:POT family proton-dependent oligopeptide transporter